MRKSLVLMMVMASAAMPVSAAVAGDEHRSDSRSSARSERPQRAERAVEVRAERPQRAERSVEVRAERPQRTERSMEVRAERPQRAERAMEVRAERPQRAERVMVRTERPQRIERPMRVENVERVDTARRSISRTDQSGDTSLARERIRARTVTRDGSDSVTNWRSRERRAGSTTTATRPRLTTSSPAPVVRTVESSPTTSSTSSKSGTKHYHHHHWSSDWRNDHRYDWRSHRSRYGSLFRFGSYYDPYGYGYRPFSVGYSMWPSYYSSNYWLNDPWQYRLPAVYGPYRWVRYYDDALLVDIYSGEVVDVIRNFFW